MNNLSIIVLTQKIERLVKTINFLGSFQMILKILKKLQWAIQL